MIIDPKVKEIQEESLVAFKYFHKLCLENKINYSMHGGSLLGAVREKGFIPWDDDIDVSMTRSEFDKFYALLQNYKLDDGFYYDDQSFETLHFCLKREGYPLVWITVFVYDYISEKYIEQKLKIFLMGIMLIRLNTAEEILENKKNKNVKGKIKIILEYLIWLMFKFETRTEGLKCYSRFCQNTFNGKRQFIHRANDVYIPTGAKNILPKDVMSEYTIVPFEDTEAMITVNYHEILVSSYGKNYMTPIKDDTREEEHKLVRDKLNIN